MTGTRWSIVCASLAIASCTKSQVAWRDELASRDSFSRGLAAIALCELAPESAPLELDALLETIDHAELGLRRTAEHELVRVAPYALEALVTELVRDEFMTLDRRAAIERALIAAGSPAAATLVAALRGGERAHANALCNLLVRCGPNAVDSLLEACGESAAPEFARIALDTLARIGPAARDALPALRALRARAEAGLRADFDAALTSLERSR
jgi:hypothetical protein